MLSKTLLVDFSNPSVEYPKRSVRLVIALWLAAALAGCGGSSGAVDGAEAAAKTVQTASSGRNAKSLAVANNSATVSTIPAVTISCRGTSSGGIAPHVVVKAAGVVIGSMEVSNPDDAEFTFQAPGLAVGDRVEIDYTNDVYANGEDRNLFVDKITALGVEVLPTNSIVGYDLFEVDGKDIIAGQVAMYWSGALFFDIPGTVAKSAALSTSASAVTDSTAALANGVVTVFASGSMANGIGPIMNVFVNGVQIGSQEIVSSVYQNYVFPTSVFLAGSRIDVQYANDLMTATEDRNLFVDGIFADSIYIPSTSSSAQVDWGPLDGVDVAAGQTALLSNGTLRFTVPGAASAASVSVSSAAATTTTAAAASAAAATTPAATTAAAPAAAATTAAATAAAVTTPAVTTPLATTTTTTTATTSAAAASAPAASASTASAVAAVPAVAATPVVAAAPVTVPAVVTATVAAPAAQVAAGSSLLTSSTYLTSSSNQLVSFGTRRMVSGYNGMALRVQRASDTAEIDIGFSGDALDSVAASVFAGGSQLVVTKVYAQDGSGRDLTALPATAPWLITQAGFPATMIFRQDQYFSMPASLRISRNDFSAFFVGRLTSQFRPTPLLDFGQAAGVSDFAWQQVYTDYRAQLVTPSGVVDSGQSMRSMGSASPSVFGVVSGSLKSVLHRDDYSEAGRALDPATLSAGKILGSHLPYVYGRADLMAFVFSTVALSDTDAIAVKSALRNRFGTLSSAPKRHVFIQGDSITEGVGSPNNVTIGRALNDAFGDGATLVRSFGKSGDRMEDSYASFVFADPGSFLEPSINNVLVTWLGTNDIASNRTLAQIQTDIRAYEAGAIKQGWTKRIYATALPRADFSASQELLRQSLNSWIRANNEGLFNAVWDADLLAQGVGPLLNYATDSSLSPDHLHPSEAAYVLMAPSLKAVINAVAP